MRFFPFFCNTFALFLCASLSSWSSAAVQLRGSTTLLPLAQMVAEAYMAEHPTEKIVVSGGGTERGYKSIMDNTADIAMASSEPSQDYLNQNVLHQRDIEKFLIAYAPIYIAVNRNNSVTNLTEKQLSDIYTGRVLNWSVFGGKPQLIDVLVGPPTGGVNATWKTLILKNIDTYTPSAKVLSNEDRYEFLQQHSNAIAFLVGDIKDFSAVKLLSIDQVVAEDVNIKNGSYRLRAPLFLVTQKNPRDEVKNFIGYFQTYLQKVKPQGIVTLNDSVK